MSELASIGSTQPGHFGAAGPSQLSLRPVAIGTVWNLQGAADNPVFVAHATSLWGIDALPLPHRVVTSATHRLLWIGPKSWLVFSQAAVPSSGSVTEPMFSESRNRLNAAGGALFDVSASRVGWALVGPRALDVLASGCPLDLHPQAFVPNCCAQSLFGHVAALYQRQADGGYRMYVARSFANDVWAALCASAAQYGYEVLPDAV